MKLIEALRILQKPMIGAEPFRVFLASGFEPLHLKTFLAAHLQIRSPDRVIFIETGQYGDCLGNVDRAAKAQPHAVAVMLEWPDLDLHLGIRHLGGWNPGDLRDIVKNAQAKLSAFQNTIVRAAERLTVVLCLPTLPLPPVSFQSSHQASPFELALKESVTGFASNIACHPNVVIVNPQSLDGRPPLCNRLDVKSELAFGFPYQLTHASIMGELLASLLRPPAPKKGLISDLDGTLWKGILGEVGVDGVSWDLNRQSQVHGLYQQLLRSLSEAGTLVAIASKNDPTLVEEAFKREDMILTRDHVFPIAAGWGPKSEAVGRILQAWNISADAVVYVDDSLSELAEVGQPHSGLECLHFIKNDCQAVYELLEKLRDIFGKMRITQEDELRLESTRAGQVFREESDGGEQRLDEFLKTVDAQLVFDFTKLPPDPRAYELVNKTNQFNLNGKRYTESEWRASLEQTDTFHTAVSYKDKFGDLGKIALLSGTRRDKTLRIETWVMSCRAFTRRIEHQCLNYLFSKFEVEIIAFDFQPTERNTPLQEFFTKFSGRTPEPGFQITKALFLHRCPPLFHRIKAVPYE